MSYGFRSKFHMLSISAKNCENQLRFDNVTDSLKVGTFFETQCSQYMVEQKNGPLI